MNLHSTNIRTTQVWHHWTNLNRSWTTTEPYTLHQHTQLNHIWTNLNHNIATSIWDSIAPAHQLLHQLCTNYVLHPSDRPQLNRIWTMSELQLNRNWTKYEPLTLNQYLLHHKWTNYNLSHTPRTPKPELKLTPVKSDSLHWTTTISYAMQS